MSSLTVQCKRCGKIFEFDWNFEDFVTLFSNQCKRCDSKFILEQPKQKTENIITDRSFLPYGIHLNGFYFKRSAGMFYFYLITKEKIKLPILLVNKTIKVRNENGCGRVSKSDEFLIQLDDIENFVNSYNM